MYVQQKVVIKLSMNDHKSRVESVAIKGQENNQLEVVGQVDAVVLATLLRKCLGKAELVSVGAAGGDKNANKADTPAAQVQHGSPNSIGMVGVSSHSIESGIPINTSFFRGLLLFLFLSILATFFFKFSLGPSQVFVCTCLQNPCTRSTNPNHDSKGETNPIVSTFTAD
nr:heavy metal-associated isoprenylated plant protein 16-like [Ipomoea batatas]